MGLDHRGGGLDGDGLRWCCAMWSQAGFHGAEPVPYVVMDPRRAGGLTGSGASGDGVLSASGVQFVGDGPRLVIVPVDSRGSRRRAGGRGRRAWRG